MRVGKRKDEMTTEKVEPKDTGAVAIKHEGLEEFYNWWLEKGEVGRGRGPWGQKERYCRAPVQSCFGMSWGRAMIIPGLPRTVFQAPRAETPIVEDGQR